MNDLKPAVFTLLCPKCDQPLNGFEIDFGAWNKGGAFRCKPCAVTYIGKMSLSEPLGGPVSGDAA